MFDLEFGVLQRDRNATKALHSPVQFAHSGVCRCPALWPHMNGALYSLSLSPACHCHLSCHAHMPCGSDQRQQCLCRIPPSAAERRRTDCGILCSTYLVSSFSSSCRVAGDGSSCRSMPRTSAPQEPPGSGDVIWSAAWLPPLFSALPMAGAAGCGRPTGLPSVAARLSTLLFVDSGTR